MSDKKKKKYKPVHLIAISILKDAVEKGPDSHHKQRIETLIRIYKSEGKVPSEANEPLTDAFAACIDVYVEKYPEIKKPLERVIKKLQAQRDQDLEKKGLESLKRERKREEGHLVLFEDARKAIKAIVKKAEENLDRMKNGGPVAITVMDSNFQRIAFGAMDGVLPISRNLSEAKAWTALSGLTDTIHWEESEKKKGTDGRNFADPKWTNFGGGVIVKVHNKIIGAIGVSGRHSTKKNIEDENPPLQDHELAEIGEEVLIKIYS
jgi:uncharacterized protein GlcG (DUF336 family)